MRWDTRAAAWLDDVLAQLRALGVADLCERVVAQVWERNVDRYDPVVAGDTATSLGITAAENIRTLLLREDPEVWRPRGVALRAAQHSLTIDAADVHLQVMKAADRRLDPDPDQPLELEWSGTRWDAASDVRRGAAVDNARRYEPRVHDQWGQTWMTGLVGDHDARPSDDPARLRHVVLVWAGDPTSAATTGWLGVPYAGAPGTSPWLATREMWHHGPDDVPHPPEPIIAVPRARRGAPRA
jgi:hypothetical protein